MTRYDFSHPDPLLDVKAEGRFVLFADHESAMAAKDAEIERLQNVVSRYIRFVKKARETLSSFD